MRPDTGDQHLEALMAARFERSISVPTAFFTAEAETIARACQAMAQRFLAGGRLLALGNGAWVTDARHVAVEFVHPVIVGKRALPALALTADTLASNGISLIQLLQIMARPQDIALGFSVHGDDADVLEALQEARRRGLLTLVLAGSGGEKGAARQADADFCFVVQASDPLVIQETHEMLYHVLWELVHVFLEYEELQR